MQVGADTVGSKTTSSADPRLTPFGAVIRRLKIDELPQFVNVLAGDMSVVGPRPQLPSEVENYTLEERKLLTAQPGLSDYASVVFADLGEIVRIEPNAYLAYQQLVRPWKSRLGIFYVEHPSLIADCWIVLATAAAIVSHRVGLALVVRTLRGQKAPDCLVKVAERRCRLQPTSPPGSDRIVGID